MPWTESFFSLRLHSYTGTALLAGLILASAGGCSDDIIGPKYPVGPDRITLLGNYDSRNPAWAPDGDTIVFHAWGTGPGREVLVQRLSAPATVRQLTHDGKMNIHLGARWRRYSL